MHRTQKQVRRNTTYVRGNSDSSIAAGAFAVDGRECACVSEDVASGSGATQHVSLASKTIHGDSDSAITTSAA